MSEDKRILLDIWSDYVCPFCYLELPEITRLQQEFGAQLSVTWHAFELRPDPVPTLDPDGEYLHNTWNRSVYPMAAQRNMRLRLPPVQPRSRKAFEVACHAREQGRFDAMHAALFRGFFEEGRDIGDIETLLMLAESAGLEPNALREALEQDRYTQEVIEDEMHATALGISGVPLGLVRLQGQPLAASIPLQGAVPYEALLQTVRHVASL
ncbi:DsbA family oxidoreductase [Noviherbaspirillum pedocola]|uniref:DsbA family oxidoreductase n=1 Tax=Noviherbaspirillum pedocola TaxID=2801341 RepID=A0A934SSJ7_9BURK|nr:DsbA family oxidoreductase [Noviherbaspirillum pedocola]MBK4735810.1 DsbA family oxidoreductase [Noviherbaspirillum pedocola]